MGCQPAAGMLAIAWSGTAETAVRYQPMKRREQSLHAFSFFVNTLLRDCSRLRCLDCQKRATIYGTGDGDLAKVLGALDTMARWMSELTEQGLKLLIPTYYKSEKDLVKEAFRIIIRNNPGTRINLALKLYNSKKTSLAKSAEIAGLTTIEFKELLADRGIKREIEGDEIEAIDRKIKEVFG